MTNKKGPQGYVYYTMVSDTVGEISAISFAPLPDDQTNNWLVVEFDQSYLLQLVKLDLAISKYRIHVLDDGEIKMDLIEENNPSVDNTIAMTQYYNSFRLLDHYTGSPNVFRLELDGLGNGKLIEPSSEYRISKRGPTPLYVTALNEPNLIIKTIPIRKEHYGINGTIIDTLPVGMPNRDYSLWGQHYIDYPTTEWMMTDE